MYFMYFMYFMVQAFWIFSFALLACFARNNVPAVNRGIHHFRAPVKAPINRQQLGDRVCVYKKPGRARPGLGGLFQACLSEPETGAEGDDVLHIKLVKTIFIQTGIAVGQLRINVTGNIIGSR